MLHAGTAAEGTEEAGTEPNGPLPKRPRTADQKESIGNRFLFVSVSAPVSGAVSWIRLITCVSFRSLSVDGLRPEATTTEDAHDDEMVSLLLELGASAPWRLMLGMLERGGRSDSKSQSKAMASGAYAP